MTRQLTDMQQRFLDVLFEEAEGDYKTAKELAGYSDNVSVKSVVEALEEEIATLVHKAINANTVKAVYTMKTAMENPVQVGLPVALKAAQDQLDRAGFKATDKVEVKAENPLFILPAKSDEDN